MAALRQRWDDSREAANLARGCDVVTLEIEQISGEHGGGGKLRPVPGGAMLAVIRTGSNRRIG
jgi:5-(carboxyamino)imidazole ribonucleotide synthase